VHEKENKMEEMKHNSLLVKENEREQVIISAPGVRG
jgi:hypothetical protein